jgi:hypothetical protein
MTLNPLLEFPGVGFHHDSISLLLWIISEKVVIFYEKRGNAENYIKEAKYDTAVGHLLLKSFWANEAVFQMMMLSFKVYISCCQNNQDRQIRHYEAIRKLSTQGSV